MRVFIAINFSKEVKRYITDIQKKVMAKSAKGNFTPEENLHITLRFIGEVDSEDVESLAIAIRETGLRFKSFDMRLSGLGFFSRGDKCIAWVGSDKSKKLEMLFNNLEKNLMRQGFGRARQELTPHITIGREVVLKASYDKMKAEVGTEGLEFKVDSIMLMESVRRGSKLIYKPLFMQKLK